MDYVVRCTLEMDGKSITSFKAFYEGEEVYSKAINLMNDTGFADVTTRYTFGVDYVVPTTGPEHDFAGAKDVRFTVEFDGGKRTTYTGCRVLKKGEATLDGENELARRYDFGARGKIEE